MSTKNYPHAASAAYKSDLRALRKSKRLHSAVEEKLIELLKHATPEFHAVKEPQGLPGGRNDLMLFEFRGRSVVFELFATAGQVSRDLLILHKTPAAIKIAIIIDQAVDAAVLNQYLRQNPSEPFPFLFTAEIFTNDPQNAVLKLREIICGEEEALFRRMLRAKVQSVTPVWSQLKNAGANVLDQNDIKTKNITYAKAFTTLVLSKCLKLGVRGTQLEKLGAWLSNDGLLRYILLRVSMGLNMFLYTDFDQNMAIYADIELVDWIRAGYKFDQAFALLSMNGIVEEIETKYLKAPQKLFRPAEITITIGSCQMHQTDSGRAIVVNLPSEIRSVILTPPVKPEKQPDDYRDMIQISHPGKPIEIG